MLHIPDGYDMLNSPANAVRSRSSNNKLGHVMLEQEEYEKMSFIEKKLGTGNSYKEEALLMLVNEIGREHKQRRKSESKTHKDKHKSKEHKSSL